MASETGSFGAKLVVALVVAAGAYYALPTVKKWIDKPEHLKANSSIVAPPLGTSPFGTLPLGTSLEKRASNGMTSAELRDSLIEKAQKSTGKEPTLAEWMQLTPADYAAVQAALKATPPSSKPPESKTPFQFPNGKLITPSLTSNLDSYFQKLKMSTESQPVLASGKSYQLEELVTAVQPAVPMIRVFQKVRCEVDRRVIVITSGTETPVTERIDLVVERHSFGTGFFIDANGHVVTNCHVAGPPSLQKVNALVSRQLNVKPGESVRIIGNPEMLSSEITLVIQGQYRPFAKILPEVGPAEAQRSFEIPAKLVGYDFDSDLAVLKVNGCTFPYLSFANPIGMKVGQAVTSVGYPTADAIPGPPTAIDGTISGLDRSPMDGVHADSVQHSASINGGNSGGPLINRAGQVVGVNTYGFSDQSIQGINFSRGPRTTVPFVEQMIRLGSVVRPDTGFIAIPFDLRRDKTAREANLSYSTSIVVGNIKRATSAEAADIILQINGRSVTTEGEWNDALGLLEKTRPATVRLTIKRAPETLKAEAARKKIDWDVVLRAAWEAKETEIDVALNWPK